MAEFSGASAETVRSTPQITVPALGMLVDRTSFDETDNYNVNVDPSIMAWTKREGHTAESFQIMKNGQVRRRLRWKPKIKRNKEEKRNATCDQSVVSTSNFSTVSRASKASVHSLASTQTVKHSNNSPKVKPSSFDKRIPLRGFTTIANDDVGPRSRSTDRNALSGPPKSHGLPPLTRKSSAKRFGLPPMFRHRSSPTVDTDCSSSESGGSPARSFDDGNFQLPSLEDDNDDASRRVDLRIPIFKDDCSDARNSSTTWHRVPSDASRFQYGQSSTPRVSFRTESLEFIGQKDADSPVTSPVMAEQEIRFVMAHDTTTPPVREAAEDSRKDTGPVDIDDGTFLEVEKNLHAIHEMAAEHLKYREYSEALEVFEEILRGQLARYGPQHYRVGTAHHNIAIVHLKRGDHQRAIQSCRKAITIRKNALGDDHLDLADSLTHLGVCYLESYKYAKAVEIFREALKIRRRKLGQRHPKVSKILNNIGCALYEMNELEVAKIAFDEALTVQRTQLQNAADDSSRITDQSLLSLACTLSNLGSIKLYWGQYDDALADLEEALVIQESVLGESHPLSCRTEESLLWVERARHGQILDSPPTRDLAEIHTVSTSSEYDGESDILEEEEEGPPPTFGLCAGREGSITRPRKGNRLLESIGRNIMALQAGLELTCGAMEEMSDDDDDQASF